MRFIKVIFALNSIPLNLWGAVLLFYLKKLLFIKVSDKDINIKKLVSSIIETKGEISHYNDKDITLSFIINSRQITLMIRNNPYSDIGILHELTVQKEYDMLFAILSDRIETNSSINIIDAGSNIGLFTLFSKMYFPNAKISLIEPDTEAINQFLRISQVNKLDMFIVFNCGLLNESNVNINISEGIRGPGNAGYIVEKSANNSNLKSINLNEIVDKSSFDTITLLKLDIEGSEQNVILGDNFNDLIAQKIQYIALEIHDDQVNRNLIENRLLELNFIKIDNRRVDIYENKKFRQVRTIRT